MTAVVLCILWLLWPVIAFAGGLSYPIFAGLAALVLLPSAARSLRPQLYMGALLAFFVFAGVSAFWSPRQAPLVEFDFASMKFAVRSEMIRVGLLVIAIGGLIAAASQLDHRGRIWVTRAARASLIVQLVIVTLLSLYETQALQLFSGFMSEPGEGIQNISRNSLIMAAAAPILAIDLSFGRMRRGGTILAAAVVGIAAADCYLRGVNAGILAILAAMAGMGIVRLFPRIGFRIIATGIAVILVLAPWIFDYLAQDITFANVAAGDTVGIRFAVWNHAVEIIRQEPVLGHGLGALRTMRETIESGAFAGQFKLPNHPHNMPLQLWAETGGVGAGLLALAVLLAGWRLPAPWVHGAAGLKAAAIAGAMAAVACVSFDLWNEWWWAVGGLIAVLAVATPVRQPLREDRMITITFGEPVQVLTMGGSPEPAMALEAAARENAAQQAAEGAPAAQRAGPRARASVAAEPPREWTMYETFKPGRSAPDTRNNFNLLRLLFALMVALFHLALLSGVAGWQTVVTWLTPAAEIGVQGFFILSGYLVFASLERTRSVEIYAEKRVRRLYPAYATVVIACALAALAFVPAARAAPLEVARYLGWNLIFLNFGAPTLPGVFGGNPLHEVNGALWTLKIEVLFYLILPVLAWVLRAAGRSRWILIALIYVAAEAWRIGFRIMGQGEGGGLFEQLYPQLPGQMSFFITGIGLRLLDREGFRPTLVGATVGLGILVATLMYREAEPLRAVGLGLIVAWVAIGIPRLFDAAAFGDISYGLYIVHFPIIQVIVALGLFTTPFIGVSAAIVLTLAASLLLWHAVEKPALRNDSAYRKHG